VLNYGLIRLGRKTRRAVAQRVNKPRTTTRTSTKASTPYGKHRPIASSNGLIVSGVSSPILETRKLFPLIFP
jgi:hypothetical protein